jgi:hypothetical protein
MLELSTLHMLHASQASCAHEQKTHGLQWIELIGVANKHAVLACLTIS